VDRKYSHRGYRDAGKKTEKKEKTHDRKRLRADRVRRRSIRAAHSAHGRKVTRARCSNCGVLAPGIRSNGTCPKCQQELHCCKQCRFFDSGAQFDGTQPIPERISPRTRKNDCKFFEFRMTVEKDTARLRSAASGCRVCAGSAARHSDARAKPSKIYSEVASSLRRIAGLRAASALSEFLS